MALDCASFRLLVIALSSCAIPPSGTVEVNVGRALIGFQARKNPAEGHITARKQQAQNTTSALSPTPILSRFFE